MIYFQKWKENTFEFDYLEKIKQIFNKKPNFNLYIGFDYGFFCGINIYYGSKKNTYYAKKLYDLLTKYNLNIRLFTNIDYDIDVIILLGYPNTKKQRQYLWKKQKIIMKALSKFESIF